MIWSFIQQIFYAVIFFLGIAGSGLVISHWLKFSQTNIFLRLASSFFISLCLYTFLAVALLFVLPNKLLALEIFSWVYFMASLAGIIWYLIQKIKEKAERIYFLKDNWVFPVSLLAVLFVFFLSVYQTSILDEWLHRPIVKFFTTNGIFPLQHPLSPGENFIYNYHYGMDIVASAIQIITRIGVSESLDILKLAGVIATFCLLYGIILKWSDNKNYALLGAVAVFFCGGSFFFLDGFTTTYLFRWGDDIRAMNFPLSYSLAGITWINLPLALSFLLIMEDIFYVRKDYQWSTMIFLAIVLGGFFLISELFGMLIVLVIFFITILNILKRAISFSQVFIAGIVFSVILSVGILATGGVVTNLLLNGNKSAVDLGQNENCLTNRIIYLKTPFCWGYPDGKSVIKPAEHPFLYLRNFMLEALIVILILYAAIRRKLDFSQNPTFWFAIVVSLAIPFFIATSMNSLNLYKLAQLGLLILNLSLFYALLFLKRRIEVFMIFVLLFMIGGLSTVAVNFNIHWQWNKLGKSIYCAESDLCYGENEVKILRTLEQNNPGIKHILSSDKNRKKVVDLTNAYAIATDFKNISQSGLKEINFDYIFITPDTIKNLKKNKNMLDLSDYEKVLAEGDYAILKAK